MFCFFAAESVGNTSLHVLLIRTTFFGMKYRRHRLVRQGYSGYKMKVLFYKQIFVLF